MSLATIAADVKNDLGTLLANAQDDYNRVKTNLEQKWPEIERVGALIDSDPLVKIAIDDTVPASLRELAAEGVAWFVKSFQAAPAAPAAPVEPPADPSAPAAA